MSGWPAQHETQVEPDSFSFGSTIVTVFQSGRHLDGGAERNGFSTSKNGGRTWRAGLLPTGSFERVSDPVIAYDAEHKWWLAASLGTNFSTNGIVISRSRDGLSWRAPVDAARSSVEDYDKEWIACDNWRTSRFRGRCYVSYMNFRRAAIETRRSTDGGRTWSAPVAIVVQRPPAQPNGIQIVTRPNGNVLLLLTIFGAPTGNEIAQLRSTDGGVSFSQPTAVAPLGDTDVSWLRAPPFVSADVDADGTVYVAWRDCERSVECSADIVLATSRDGVRWNEPTRIPTGPFEGFYFLPALAVDPATSGAKARLALLYHSMSPSHICDPTAGCLGIDVRMVTSTNGGRSWTAPRRLNAFSMPPFWMADTSLGPDARRLLLRLVGARPTDRSVLARLRADRRPVPPVDLRDDATALASRQRPENSGRERSRAAEPALATGRIALLRRVHPRHHHRQRRRPRAADL